jgi:hypothetical protein
MDVRCDVCFQRVALTGKKSKRGPDKVSHHYRPGMGVCAGSYATPTDAMRAEGEAHAKEERERWERLRREQEERAAEEDRAKQAQQEARREAKASARAPARLHVIASCIAMLAASLRAMERGGALTTDQYDLHLATMSRWVDGNETSGNLDAAGAWLYNNRNQWRCEPDETDENIRFNTSCMNSIAWAMWSLSSFMRSRHNGDVLTRCRMTMAMVLARFGEDPRAAVARALEMTR